MNLGSISIKRYRSAQNVDLLQVGDFNVFIGKNNSGKSTILRAIRAFFTCLKRGHVVALYVPIGKDVIDYTNRKTNDTIDITATFSMQLAERDALIRDIASEAPQLKNAVDGLDPSLLLEVQLRIAPPPLRFAYTQRLALVSQGHGAGAPERVLYRMDSTSARELAEKLRDVRRSAAISEDIGRALKAMDEDDFHGMRRSPDESVQQARYAYFIRRTLGEPTGDSVSAVETLLRQSSSFADFQSNAKIAIAKYNEQSSASQSAPVKNAVETFSGQQVFVPQYILSLIKTIGSIQVLYLTEHRKPVGREEAERLLQLKVERGGDEVLSNIKT
jgi:putative ATP-dependent endonuclease of OLD family